MTLAAPCPVRRCFEWSDLRLVVAFAPVIRSAGLAFYLRYLSWHAPLLWFVPGIRCGRHYVCLNGEDVDTRKDPCSYERCSCTALSVRCRVFCIVLAMRFKETAPSFFYLSQDPITAVAVGRPLTLLIPVLSNLQPLNWMDWWRATLF